MGVRGRLIALLAASLATSAGAGTGVEIVDGIPTPVRTAADVLAGDVKAQFGTIDQVVAGTVGPDGFPVEVSAGVRIGRVISDSLAAAPDLCHPSACDQRTATGLG